MEQKDTDYIIRMITISESTSYLTIYEIIFGTGSIRSHIPNDNNNRDHNKWINNLY